MPVDRGRLTIVDVLHIVFAVAILATLYPVYYSLLQSQISHMSTAMTFLLQLVLPIAVLVIFTVLFREAVRGVGV